MAIDNSMRRFCREGAKKIINAGYSIGRKIGYNSYLVIPGLSYLGAKFENDAINSIPFWNPAKWTISVYELFGGEKIQTLREVESVCGNAFIGGVALALTKGINRMTEKIAPKRHNVRNLMEGAIYGSIGVELHEVAKANSLESILNPLNSMDLLIESIAHAGNGAIDHTHEIISNLPEINPQNLMLTGSAVFLGMAGYRFFNIVDRCTFGLDLIREARDKYVEKKFMKRK